MRCLYFMVQFAIKIIEVQEHEIRISLICQILTDRGYMHQATNLEGLDEPCRQSDDLWLYRL